MSDFLALPESDRLVQTFGRLPESARRKVVDLIELLAPSPEDAPQRKSA